MLGRTRENMNTHPAAVVVLSLLAAAAPPPPRPAQSPPARPAQSPRGLEPEPLVAEAIGLSMYLPSGGASRATFGPDGIAYLAGDDPQTWSMRISTLLPSVSGATAAALAADQLQAIEKTGRPAQVLANSPRTCGTAQGHLLYVQQTLNNQPVVNGWLILPTSPQSFVVLTLFCEAAEFPRLRPTFDATFETIQLRTAAEFATRKEALLARGREVLATFTPERLRAVIGDRQWYRVYRPAAPGVDETELAFLGLQLTEGRRGELTPERSPDSFGAMESETGLLVQLEARYVDNAAADRYVDVDARYWLSWDRQSEAWSIRQTQRVAAASRTAAETGVRSGPKLEVIHSSREQQTREPESYVVPDVYLAQAEALALGGLLPRDGRESIEMSFASYDSKSRRLVERVDSWGADRDGTAAWALTSILLSETSPVRQLYDASGRRLRRVDPDGTTTERIELADLRRLWQSKGLRSGAGSKGGG